MLMVKQQASLILELRPPLLSFHAKKHIKCIN
jgi:hypothetical protein